MINIMLKFVHVKTCFASFLVRNTQNKKRILINKLSNMAKENNSFLKQESDILTDDYDEDDYIDSQYIGKFSASEIAALIGKNEYRSIAQALYKVLLKHEKFESIIEEIKRETNNKNEKLVNRYMYHASNDIKKIIEEVSVIKGDDGEGDGNGEAKQQSSIENIDSYIDDQISSIMSNMNISEGGDAAQKLTKRVQKEIRSRVNMARGVKLENVSLDQLELEHGISVSKRNSKLYKYECEKFKLSGKIDGYDDKNECVIEIKNRVKFVKNPPHYDMIQCVIYMKLTNSKKCLLVECFPDKSTRQTLIEWNQNEYEGIHENLCDLVNKIRKMTKNEVIELIKRYDDDCSA